jgi:hypothetical protein
MSSIEDSKSKKTALQQQQPQLQQQQQQQNAQNSNSQKTRLGILPSENIKEKQVCMHENIKINFLYSSLWTLLNHDIKKMRKKIISKFILIF